MSEHVQPLEEQGATAQRHQPCDDPKVIFASSLGTVFEWYDFFLYGALAAVISKQFFAGVNDTTAFIFALMAFAAGFMVRPFGALVFGRLGDMIGRKYTFLVTIVLMGVSTFCVGLLPTYASIGIAAPIILVVLRMLQGLALGGEYGGAATYVAEHAPHGKRGFHTSWIQSTATLGLLLSLLVVLGCRYFTGDQFEVWGWRIPFLLSIVLLGISTWIRLSLHESPAFVKMKEEGKTQQVADPRILRQMGEPQGRADRPVQHQRRAGGDLLRGAVLRAVLPDPVPEDGPRPGQHPADHQCGDRRAVLHLLRLAVGQGRAQTGADAGPAAGDRAVLPDVQDAQPITPTRRSTPPAVRRRSWSPPTRRAAPSSSTRSARREFDSPCDKVKTFLVKQGLPYSSVSGSGRQRGAGQRRRREHRRFRRNGPASAP